MPLTTTDSSGRAIQFSGDIFTVVPDRRWVSFMYSYPNLIPERPRTIRRAVRRSAERYCRFALDG